MFIIELAMVLHYYHWLWYIILTLICFGKGFWHLNIYHNMNFIVVKGLGLNLSGSSAHPFIILSIFLDLVVGFKYNL